MKSTISACALAALFAAAAFTSLAGQGGLGGAGGSQASAGSAGTLGPAGGSSGAAATTTTKTTGHKHKAAATKYKGYLTGVDQTAKSFNVASTPESTDVLTLKVNDKTRYSPKGTGWDDVKVGAKVSGTYKNDGTDNWALTVHFWKEKAAKAAKGGTGGTLGPAGGSARKTTGTGTR
jgi:hypothetical protein